MDALSEILRSARLTGGVFLRAEFSEPWCLTSMLEASDCTGLLGPTDHLVLYHYVIEGRLNVEMDDQARETFSPGQAVIFPRNDQHNLTGYEPAKAISTLDVTSIPGPGELMVIEHGGDGEKTRIVCGFLGGQGLTSDPLFAALPSLIRYDASAARAGDLVRASLEFAAGELANGDLGSDAMLARISEMLFVEAVRSYVETLPGDSGGWLETLRDRVLSKAVALIHRHPEQPWTVEELGREAGASRTTLTEKFVRISAAPRRNI